jgi:hypothetical protein
MGEGSKPELVTVTPSTRGTGNHAGPTVSSGGRFGGGQPIVIENIITLDGQVIDRRIRKVALDGYGLQVSSFILQIVNILCITRYLNLSNHARKSKVLGFMKEGR